MKKNICIKIGSKRIILDKKQISTPTTKKLLVSFINQQKKAL
jgi:hypothetical protein